MTNIYSCEPGEPLPSYRSTLECLPQGLQEDLTQTGIYGDYINSTVPVFNYVSWFIDPPTKMLASARDECVERIQESLSGVQTYTSYCLEKIEDEKGKGLEGAAVDNALRILLEEHPYAYLLDDIANRLQSMAGIEFSDATPFRILRHLHSQFRIICGGRSGSKRFFNALGFDL